ncbi:cobalt ABC transporter ATP-binding protein [Williamsia sp. 1138]|uniref:energy-coupling factor ABC transporter ATP-binding protein n=1 Tax=Williamsia sp. 1138 TaxID=1903117 RepID=UPI000A0FBD01|nr:ABC transporter ATP-binding protein [Williamsia sp. 1138]OZG27277.1 cobalt ABC transporter ATP-binding protein [Williamsia sp. 1138]
MTAERSQSGVVFENVGHAFGDRTVVRDVSLTLTERRIGIVGSNGSGKSTLARMVNGLVIPDRGSVWVNGVPTRRRAREVRKMVGFVFTDPDRQIIMPTVAEDVDLSLSRSELSREEREHRVAQTLKRFGLHEHADRPAHRLSGGQKQLLALASVLVTDPAVIVADEPTTLLDLRNTSMLRNTFATIDEQLIVVSHDLELLSDFDRVIVIDDGAVHCDGPPGVAIAAYRELMS